MSKVNDGGPAFPIPGFNDDPNTPSRFVHPQEGMTLRDWFAGLAMHAFASPHSKEWASTMVICAKQTETTFAGHASSMAYELADAMLTERSKTK